MEIALNGKGNERLRQAIASSTGGTEHAKFVLANRWAVSNLLLSHDANGMVTFTYNLKDAELLEANRIILGHNALD